MDKVTKNNILKDLNIIIEIMKDKVNIMNSK